MSHHRKNKDATGGSVKAPKPERDTNRSTIGGAASASGRGTAASGGATGSAPAATSRASAPPSRQAHANHGEARVSAPVTLKELKRFIYTAAGSVARDVDWLGLPAQLSSDEEKRLVRKVKRRVRDAMGGPPIDRKHLEPDAKDVVKRYVSIHLHCQCSRAGTASGTSLAGTTTPLYK
jgi:hypothetical protein